MPSKDGRRRTLRPILKGGLRLIVTTLRSRPSEIKVRTLRELTQSIWPEIEAGRIKPSVHKVFPISDGEAAHGILYRRENIEKVVLSDRKTES